MQRKRDKNIIYYIHLIQCEQVDIEQESCVYRFLQCTQDWRIIRLWVGIVASISLFIGLTGIYIRVVGVIVPKFCEKTAFSSLEVATRRDLTYLCHNRGPDPRMFISLVEPEVSSNPRSYDPPDILKILHSWW